MTDQTLAPPSPRSGMGLLLGGIVLAWGAVVTALAGDGAFLALQGVVPVRILPFAGLPPVLFLLAWRFNPALRTWAATIDLAVLVGLQAFRVVGIVFLAFWLMGALPVLFAWPAALGDIAVGVLAVGVTLAVARQSPGWERRVRALNGWGMVDFAVAFALAILTNQGMPLNLPGAPVPQAVLTLPLALIPAFFVPLFMIAHLITWLRLRDA